MKVLFLDKQFEHEIRKKIRKLSGDIEVEDLKSIIELKIIHYSDEPQIASLEGIQYCDNLRKLELMGTYLNDIFLIKNIKKLEYLDLSDNNIKDISFICNIKTLKYLNLSGNPIKNIDYINDIRSLERINLERTDCEVPNLSNPDKIISFGLPQNCFDLEFLNRYKNLKEITLPSCLKTLEVIKEFKNLHNVESLSINNSKVSDLTPLSNLKRLKKLDLFDNNLDDISPIYNLKELISINVGINKISDISCIESLINLIQLFIV